MQATICTIGYEGAELFQFLNTLKERKVEVILDIREQPLSRKPDFSKNQLSRTLMEEGIGYVHLQGLGNPKAGREADKRGDHTTYKRIYMSHLQSKIAQADMKTAMEIAKKQRAALLCFERDPKVCHRLMTAAEIVAQTKQQIEHIFVVADDKQKEML